MLPEADTSHPATIARKGGRGAPVHGMQTPLQAQESYPYSNVSTNVFCGACHQNGYRFWCENRFGEIKFHLLNQNLQMEPPGGCTTVSVTAILVMSILVPWQERR